MAKKEEKKVTKAAEKKKVSTVKEKVEKEEIVVETPTVEKPSDTFVERIIPSAEEILAMTETPEYKEKIAVEYNPEDNPKLALANKIGLGEIAKEESVTPSELSPAAKKWRDYLRLQKVTPEDFIIKYSKTNHKFLHLIEEIIAFEKANKKD
jgi:hypothetical protein